MFRLKILSLLYFRMVLYSFYMIQYTEIHFSRLMFYYICDFDVDIFCNLRLVFLLI